MEIIQTVLTWLSIAVGLSSAWLWYKASIAVVCQGDEKDVQGYYIGMGHPWAQKMGKPISVLGTMVEASRLNKFAAIATAAAISLQVLATGFGAFAEHKNSCPPNTASCQTLAVSKSNS